MNVITGIHSAYKHFVIPTGKTPCVQFVKVYWTQGRDDWELEHTDQFYKYKKEAKESSCCWL